MSNVRTNAPEAQSWLAPRFSVVPKKRSLFLGVAAWGWLGEKLKQSRRRRNGC
jgi:hypothetical protein